MIYTMFGTEVKITSAEQDSDERWWCVCERTDGSEREYASDQLRADAGLSEIIEAIKATQETS